MSEPTTHLNIPLLVTPAPAVAPQVPVPDNDPARLVVRMRMRCPLPALLLDECCSSTVRIYGLGDIL